jgi:hypothetical protein
LLIEDAIRRVLSFEMDGLVGGVVSTSRGRLPNASNARYVTATTTRLLICN